ncbi:hypothetical protein PFISCL1PPCAC_4878, partial [Pristionchus fissidentatus]
LTVTDASGTKHEGSKMKCVDGSWKLSGTADVDVAAGSKVACVPKNCPLLPIDTFSLIFAGISIDEYKRWTCDADQSLVLIVASDFENDENTQTMHAEYIEVGEYDYRLFSSSGIKNNVYTELMNTIISAKCEDLGPRYPGVTVPRACNA